MLVFLGHFYLQKNLHYFFISKFHIYTVSVSREELFYLLAKMIIRP